MKSRLLHRNRDSVLHTVPPKPSEPGYLPELAGYAASIIYRTPIPSQSGLPMFILNSAALPDAHEVDYDALLPYVLGRLPAEDELLHGSGYEVIFFAGGEVESSSSSRKHRPGLGWFVQVYYVLSRIMRKRLQKLYIVHERSWVRILVEMFSTIVSPKFRRKISHVSSLTQLALLIPIENLLIPTTAYLYDRRIVPDIYAPYSTGKRAFGVRNPLPESRKGNTRLPRVLRETTAFILAGDNPKTEGIFRIPPSNRVKDILHEAYDRAQKFIIWSENGVTGQIPDYPGSVDVETVIAELHPSECYDVHLAAALIKNWYSDLHQPVVPHPSYGVIRERYAQQTEFSLDDLEELISPSSEWSPLPDISRQIMTRHMLPMLAAIAEHEESNKMNPTNLAVCFAPTLVCGPDQLEDAKLSSVVRRIVTAAIEYWPNGLREACRISPGQLETDLEMPTDPHDYDDPLEDSRPAEETSPDFVKQKTGIALQDDAASAPPPPLPPRPSSSSQPSGELANPFPLRRKPAPTVAAPPTYSMIFPADTRIDGGDSSLSAVRVADGFAPPKPPSATPADSKESSQLGGNEKGVPLPVLSVPKRKPLTVAQVQNLESDNATRESRRSVSDGRGAGRRGTGTCDQISPTTSSASAVLSTSGAGQPKAPTPPFGKPPTPTFAKPLWAASASNPVSGGDKLAPQLANKPGRSPSINSLARPIIPGPVLQTYGGGASLQPPPHGGPTAQGVPRVKSPTPGLLKRIHSAPLEPEGAARERRQQHVGKLDLRKQSVDDLRRLYEERAATAQALVDTMPTRMP